MTEQSLGQKIKKYRNRVKLTQLELELAINSAHGSISRIENDSVKPTKETLSKIAKALKLKSNEVADLLGLKILTPEELILAINEISSSLDLNNTLQTAVDIMFDLYPNYNGGLILLLDNKKGDRLITTNISNMPNVEVIQRIMPRKLNEYEVMLTNDNHIIKTFKEGLLLQSTNLYDFGKNVVPKIITDLITKALNFSVGLSIPLYTVSNKLGVILFTKRNSDIFDEYEVQILKLLADQIALAVYNAKRFKELQEELDLLRSDGILYKHVK
jgi:transcriptional regulator with XRE-family HTH domain